MADPAHLSAETQTPQLTSMTHDFTTAPPLHKPALFPAEPFLKVMDNLLRNPNITSSHLFRADILWDSEKDTSFNPSAMAGPSTEETSCSLSGETLQSASDAAGSVVGSSGDLSPFIKHMRPALRPWKMHMPGWRLQRTVVRRLVPRNPQLDRALVQTCHFFSRRWGAEAWGGVYGETGEEVPGGFETDLGDLGHEGEESDEEEATLVVYLPHAHSIEEVPWYHPPLRAVGFLHYPSLRGQHSQTAEDEDVARQRYNLAIYTCAFPESPHNNVNGHANAPPPPSAPASTSSNPLSNAQADRTGRTLQNLLTTIHKHASSQHLSTYTKHSHHDRLIPQKRFQDTYSRLKQTHAKTLLAAWSEQTDATKGVFEDLGVAAFCIELWTARGWGPQLREGAAEGRSSFPGFVDLACGNGVLVYILLMEGYAGWGFDARSRRTWEKFPKRVRDCLEECVLVPGVLDAVGQGGGLRDGEIGENVTRSADNGAEGGALPDAGTLPFDIPNIDDEELTGPSSTAQPAHHQRLPQPQKADKPEQATLPDHRLPNPTETPQRPASRPQPRTHNGIFPPSTFLISNHADELTCWTPLLASLTSSSFLAIPCCSHDLGGARTRFPAGFSGCDEERGGDAEDGGVRLDAALRDGGADPVGRLKARGGPSAYATLCGYLACLTREVGYVVRKEELRIPSTRNVCVVGVPRGGGGAGGGGAGGGGGADDDAHGGGAGVGGIRHGETEDEGEMERRFEVVRKLVEREMHTSISEVRRQFTERAMGPRVWGGKGGNH